MSVHRHGEDLRLRMEEVEKKGTKERGLRTE